MLAGHTDLYMIGSTSGSMVKGVASSQILQSKWNYEFLSSKLNIKGYFLCLIRKCLTEGISNSYDIHTSYFTRLLLQYFAYCWAGFEKACWHGIAIIIAKLHFFHLSRRQTRSWRAGFAWWLWYYCIVLIYFYNFYFIIISFYIFSQISFFMLYLKDQKSSGSAQ